MKTLPFVLCSLITTPLFAQGGATAVTATDFGVIASDGSATILDSEAVNTPVGRGLVVRASTGMSRMSRDGARASSFVAPTMSRPGSSGQAGFTIHESGRASSSDPNGSYAAGTSADAPNAPSPTQGAHGVAVNYPIAANTTGNVTIVWNAHASTGASVSAAIDLDGDGNADWTGTGAASDRQTIAVTAGANGVDIAITTDGSAAVNGVGNEGYAASLSVVFSPAGGGVNCTWTAFGPNCSGTMTGSDSPGPRGLQLTLSITGTTANSFGFMVFGTQAATPTPLPGNVCDLLIDRHGHGFFGGRYRTDANGDATLVMQVPARAFIVDMQGLTFDTANRAIGSTNGLNLVCQ